MKNLTSSNRGKILVVDDIATNRKLLRQTLRAINNFIVIEAINGEEAVEQFKKESPDLILMDINMPKMDGYDSATAIKAISGNNYTPVIFLTALSAEASLANALKSGGDDFISKPFKIEVLESKINAHLRIRELNQLLNAKNEQLTRLNNHLTYEQELIEYFFESAIQQSFLDKNIIKYHMSPMSSFNGDLLLVERGARGGLFLLIGDFTGHGLTAAMGTLPVAMIFFKMVHGNMSVGEIARELNLQLNKLMPVNMFFSATLLELNARCDIMSVWMGGMPENYWFGENGNLKDVIHSKHMPLGILDDSEFSAETETYSVKKADKVYLYSDGITEARSSSDEMFGNERLKDILITQGNKRFDQVLNELNNFTGEKSQNDDITLVEMTCHEIPAIKDQEVKSTEFETILPWHVSITLSDKEIQSKDPVSSISDFLGSLPELVKHKGALHAVLSEMYSNALNYSILDLDSFNRENEEQFVKFYHEREKQLLMLEGALIDFDFTFTPATESSSLQIRIKDNGKGYQGHTLINLEDKLHGRGLAIIKNFCEKISFSEDGRALEVVYRL